MTETGIRTFQPPTRPGALLSASGITKRFSGITALNAVDLDVLPGEMVGLIGPNGAGKTTFFNCLLGMLRPEGGAVHFDGHDVTRMPVHRRARLGFGRTFQRLELFSGMTVREHFLVTERARRGTGRSRPSPNGWLRSSASKLKPTSRWSPSASAGAGSSSSGGR